SWRPGADPRDVRGPRRRRGGPARRPHPRPVGCDRGAAVLPADPRGRLTGPPGAAPPPATWGRWLVVLCPGVLRRRRRRHLGPGGTPPLQHLLDVDAPDDRW